MAALTTLVTGVAGEPAAGAGAADFESALSVPAADGAEIAGTTWPAETPEARCAAGFVEATAPLGTAKNASSKATVAIQRASNLQISPTAVVMIPGSAKKLSKLCEFFRANSDSDGCVEPDSTVLCSWPMIRAMSSSYPRARLRSSVALAAVAATALLAGCGSASHGKFGAHACGAAKRGASVRLALSDVSPMPQATANEGAYVEVVSTYHGNEMAFPAAHPSAAVCEISQQRSRDGTATVVYKALRPGTITFSSTYAHVTEAMMPAMLGRLLVAP